MEHGIAELRDILIEAEDRFTDANRASLRTSIPGTAGQPPADIDGGPFEFPTELGEALPDLAQDQFGLLL